MAANPDLRLVLDFLRELRDHNAREWFLANKGRYETARAAFQAIVGEVLSRFDQVDDLGGVAVQDCVFRINRDLRFSKDKTPYKTAMSALLGRGGRKSAGRSYYFHLEPDGLSMLAGGLYEPSSAQLTKIRMALAGDARPLKRILEKPEFVAYFGGLEGESLKTAPQGYAKDHPDIELLRMKQYIAIHRLGDEAVVDLDIVSHALKVFKAMKPFEAYLESALE